MMKFLCIVPEIPVSDQFVFANVGAAKLEDISNLNLKTFHHL